MAQLVVELGSNSNTASSAVFAAPKPPPPRPRTKPIVNNLKKCKAMWDYEAQDQGELSINVGDVIVILGGDSDPDGWWTGRLNGNTGIFPGNYVQKI